MFTADGNSLNISVPITKVNKEMRTVSGFATLNNVDQAKDRVRAEASQKAFARWRGNIREMHKTEAVGKAVSIQQKQYYDKETDNFYDGIYVTAYISKGAPNTWEKVLDGTLTGFSIGGVTLKQQPVFDKSVGGAVTEILDYELTELSLVDSPCNQLANIFSIQKVIDGEDIMKGSIADLETENIFFCSEDSTALTSTEEAEVCTVCEKPMENIGWVESTSDGKKDEIKKMVSARIAKNEGPESLIDNSEGGANEMAKEETTPVEPVEEVEEETTVTEDVVVGDVPAPANDEVATDVAVEEVEETDLTKALETIREDVDSLRSSLEKRIDETLEPVKTSIEANNVTATELTKQLGSIVELVGELTKSVTALKTEHEEVQKSLGAVVKGTALKKSAEVTPAVEVKKESVWSGAFLSVNTLDD